MGCAPSRCGVQSSNDFDNEHCYSSDASLAPRLSRGPRKASCEASEACHCSVLTAISESVKADIVSEESLGMSETPNQTKSSVKFSVN